jgi:pimeloyl-ACP methyl ester carboxylesterase
MKKTVKCWIFAAIALLGISGPELCGAQELEIRNTAVQLASNVPAVLYEPVTPGDKSHIAIFVMHFASDYLHFSACTELSKRGYRVLCANNSVGRAGDRDGIDRMLLDAKLGVAYLRKSPGVRKVVLLGHSGGGMLMSAYQNIAENGLSACQGPEKLIKCSNSLAGLPAADGIMLLDAHWGDAIVNELLSWNPSVADSGAVNPDLDPYSPRNGYDPQGAKYSENFLRRYQAQVGKKMNQLVATAETQLLAKPGEEAGGAQFPMPRGSGVRLWMQDARLLSHTRNAWPLLRADGSVVAQVVYSVRPSGNQPPQGRPLNDQAATARQPVTGQLAPTQISQRGTEPATSVREFLNTYAVRVDEEFGYDEDSVRGIDWSSSYAFAPGNVKGIKVPLLTMGMTGSYEYLSSELIYQNARSADKSIAFVEGASHGLNTCTRCEKYSGQYGDTVKTLYNYIDMWLAKEGRF